MVVQLDAEARAFIAERVASGRYRDEAEVIRAALAALDARERHQWLRAAVAEGFAQVERGEFVEYTPELLDQLDREAEELFQQGKHASPDVCP